MTVKKPITFPFCCRVGIQRRKEGTKGGEATQRRVWEKRVKERRPKKSNAGQHSFPLSVAYRGM